MTYSLNDFCYKPISGQGCLVTSPMEYWQDNLDTLLADPDPKYTSQCIPPADSSSRVCVDEIGVPVMQYAVFGNTSCDIPAVGVCSACGVNATGL